MFNSKFNTLLTVLLVVAIVAIIGIIGYLGLSIYNKYYIDTEAKEIVNMFEQNSGRNIIETPTEPVDGNVVIGGVNDNGNLGTSTSTPTKYKGYTVIGTISIPAIKIEYPILEKETSQSLKIAVVYLYGVGPNKVGNTVIQGHNYRNGLFFSNLSKLKDGDKIYITDITGAKVTYEVYRNFTAKATDTSFYNRDTSGKREITLSTCTTEYSDRTIILAREV